MIVLRLGMTMVDAEAAVRGHMTVSKEVEGQQAQLNLQSIGPQHCTLFVDEGSGEMTALYDWPSIATGRIVPVWRTMPIPRDRWAPILAQTLIGKYGDPAVRGDHEAFWDGPALVGGDDQRLSPRVRPGRWRRLESGRQILPVQFEHWRTA